MTATLAAALADARVTGVDSSPRCWPPRPRPPSRAGWSSSPGDVRDWAPDGPVDVVVSNAVLHWAPATPAAPPVGRVAAAGRLARRSRCRATPRPDARAARRAVPRAAVGVPAGRRGAAVGRRPRAAGYLDVLTAAGLTPDVWETTYLHVLTGDDPVLGWVRSTGPAAGARPPPGRRGRGVHRRVRRRAPGRLPRPAGRHDAAAVPPGVRRRVPPVPCKDPAVLTGLHHVQVALPAGSEDALRAFYGGVLGIDGAGQAARPGRPGQGLVPVRRGGGPLRRRGGASGRRARRTRACSPPTSTVGRSARQRDTPCSGTRLPGHRRFSSATRWATGRAAGAGQRGVRRYARVV